LPTQPSYRSLSNLKYSLIPISRAKEITNPAKAQIIASPIEIESNRSNPTTKPAKVEKDIKRKSRIALYFHEIIAKSTNIIKRNV